MTTLVNNHVLIPNAANWRTKPRWQRKWQNEISQGVTGNESRNALRAQPRVTLQVLVTPFSGASGTPTPAQSQLDDRIRAAKKIGLGCMPYWGRGSVLAADCSTTALQLSSAFWTWKVNDFVFFSYDDLNVSFEVRQATAVNGQTLTLDQAPAHTVRAGKICWPLVYGKFSSASMAAETGQRGAISITISEIVSPATATIGALNLPASSGIGAMAVGDDFKVGGP